MASETVAQRLRRLVDAAPSSLVAVVVLGIVFAVVVGAGVVVSEVLDEVMDAGTTDHPDGRIVEWVRDNRTDALTTFFRAATHLADTWFVTILVSVTAVVLLVTRRPGFAAAVVVTTAGTAIVTRVVKELVGRQRPPPITRLVDVSGESFPSGHASQAVACYGAIALVILVTNRRRAVRVAVVVVAVAVMVLVGVSRVYLGVHWPSDVFSGWVVGLAWLSVVAAVSWLSWKLDRPQRWWRRDRAP